jgi:peptidoglycan/xylan/chitin deacetylase (PgdA/CDA1 family)
VPFHPLSPVAATNLVLTLHRTPSAAWFHQALTTVGRLYRFVTADEVQERLAGPARGSGVCHVTFDDGDRSFVQTALPVLEELRVPATLFIAPEVLASGGNYWFQELRALRQQVDDASIRRQVAAHTGWDAAQIAPFSLAALFKTLPLASIWAVIAALQQAHGLAPAPPANIALAEAAALDRHPLVAIGAHSLSHPVLANESDAEAERQIRGSVEQLTSLLGRPVRHFAYPNGAAGLDYGPREQALLAAAGIELAFTTDSGFIGPTSDPLALPRAGLAASDRETPPWILAKLLLLPVWDRLRQDQENQQRRRLASLISQPAGTQRAGA